MLKYVDTVNFIPYKTTKILLRTNSGFLVNSMHSQHKRASKCEIFAFSKSVKSVGK